MGGRTLTPVQLDGWQQGWKVPAGPGGTVTMTFAPDGTYRLGLGFGAVLLLVLACLAVFGRRRSPYEAVGPRQRLPVALLAAAAFVVTLVVGGVVMALVLVPLLLAARRWGSDLMALIAGVSFFVAGVVVAVNPNVIPAYHLGAFSASVQLLSVVAIGAVMCTVVVDEPDPTPEVPGADDVTGADDVAATDA
jgi:arabinofuranan 3-O-arabinosyltransferase